MGALFRRTRVFRDPAIRPAFRLFFDGDRQIAPRYYQRIAIDRTVAAISGGQQRVLLVMATGTGKTYTAFQIIWRLMKNKLKKRVLYLADRNILIDQTIQNDFRPFKKCDYQGGK